MNHKVALYLNVLLFRGRGKIYVIHTIMLYDIKENLCFEPYYGLIIGLGLESYCLGLDLELYLTVLASVVVLNFFLLSWSLSQVIISRTS